MREQDQVDGDRPGAVAGDERGGDSASWPSAAAADPATEAGAHPHRVRQNSASVVAVQPLGRAGGRSPLGIHTPVGVTLLALASWAVASATDVFPQAAEKLGMMIVSVVVVLMLSAVHELGHVIAGGLAGLELRSLTVGLFTLVRERRRGYDVTFNGEWIRFAGCVEHDVPPGPTWRARLSVSALGGPSANLFLGALILAAAPTDAFVRSVALWSCFFGAVNLVPLHVNGQTSDGGLVWRLWSRSRKAVAWRERLCGGGEDGKAQ